MKSRHWFIGVLFLSVALNVYLLALLAGQKDAATPGMVQKARKNLPRPEMSSVPDTAATADTKWRERRLLLDAPGRQALLEQRQPASPPILSDPLDSETMSEWTCQWLVEVQMRRDRAHGVGLAEFMSLNVDPDDFAETHFEHFLQPTLKIDSEEQRNFALRRAKQSEAEFRARLGSSDDPLDARTVVSALKEKFAAQDAIAFEIGGEEMRQRLRYDQLGSRVREFLLVAALTDLGWQEVLALAGQEGSGAHDVITPR